MEKSPGCAIHPPPKGGGFLARVDKSKNKERVRKILARLHKKITNKRKDFHWKTAKELIKKYDYIFLETLDVYQMKKVHGKMINDLGFSKFVTILKYCGSNQISQIDKWYPSSKTCSGCGHYNKEFGRYDKWWKCPKCQIKLSRDLNAAKNIYRVGTSTLETKIIRPPKAADL